MNGPEDLDRLPDVEGSEREALELMLARTLRPVDPPPEFADAVLRRAGVQAAATLNQNHAQGETSHDGGGLHLLGGSLLGTRGGSQGERSPRGLGKLLHWPTAHLQAWGAGTLAAAALALAVFAGEQLHLKREGERELAQKRALATQQFEASVRIMDQTVGSIQERTREQLRRAGVSGIE